MPNAKIRKVLISGGAPITILEGRSDYTSASWGKDDTIILAEPPRQLTHLPVAGGAPSSATIDDDGIGEFLLWPQHLPDLDRLLVTALTDDGPRAASISLTTHEVRLLALGNAPVGAVKYLPTGHLLYSQSGGLWVVPFDLDLGQPTGDPTSVVDRVLELSFVFSANSHFTVSESGSLAYLPPSHEEPSSVLASVDREGNESVLLETEGHFVYPRVSPDGRRVAVTIASPDGDDVWIIDTDRRSRSRFTTERQNIEPAWTPDGTQIAFSSTGAGSWDLWWKPTVSSGEAELLLERKGIQFPGSWSPDGSILAFYERQPETALDLYTLAVDGDRVPSELLVTPANEHSPMFSPDGQWLVYVSDETGQEEIYLQPYPGTGQRETVSTNGGREATWSADGRELYYRRGNQVLAVSIRTEPTVELGEPRVMFQASYVSEPGGGISYSPAGDGESFIMVRQGDDVAPRQIHVVFNWFNELERLVPTK